MNSSSLINAAPSIVWAWAQAQTIDGAAFISEDEFIRAYAGVVYDLNRRLRLNTLVSQQRRKADNPLFNFNNTTFSVGASLALGR